MDDNTFSIYQVKEGDEMRGIRFESLNRIIAAGVAINKENYDLVHTAPLDGMTLRDIYSRFQDERPEEYRGRSVSMSDIIVLRQYSKETANYVDNVGFRDVPQFFTGEDWSQREQTHMQTQYIGKWEDNKRVRDTKRMTWYYPDFGAYAAKSHITPGQIAEKYAEISGIKPREEKQKSIVKQLQEGAEQAARDNTERPTPPAGKNRGER
jgi:hypothetical protein